MIVLVLTSGPAAATERERRLTSGQLVIGRGTDAGWQLPDPDKAVSGRHCVVTADAGGAWLTDTSTNGVYIDDADEPVGSGRRVPLAVGMDVHIGPYVVRVVELEAVPQSASEEVLVADDDLELIRPSFIAARPEPPPSSGDAVEGGFVDPLAEDRPSSVDRERPLRGRAGAAPEPDRARQRASQPDHVAPERFVIDEPRARAERRRDFAEPVDGALDLGFGDDLLGDDAVLTPPDERAGPVLVPTPALDTGASPPQRPPSAETAHAETAREDVALTERAMVERFLDAAGVSPKALQGQDPRAAIETAGAAFRELAMGLRELLRARDRVKVQIGEARTIVGAENVNPLKVAVNAEDVVTALLRERGPGYLPPRAAAEEAFDDLYRHELAVVAGVDAAVRGLIERLDPDKLEADCSEDAWLDRFPGRRASRCWEFYRRRYSEIAESAQRRFLGEVDRDFQGAYRKMAK